MALPDLVQRQQAAARGAVMTGPKGKRRLDFDPDPVRRDTGAVMRAMDGKAPGRDGLEFAQTCRATQSFAAIVPKITRTAVPADRATTARTAASSGGASK
jgi:hypothetical protein